MAVGLDVAIVVSASYLEESLVTPVDAPRVLHIPVVDAVIGRSIPDHLNGVVNFHTDFGTHPHAVTYRLVESGVVCPKRDDDRSVFDQEILELLLVAFHGSKGFDQLVVHDRRLDGRANFRRICDVVVVDL